jgi:hypothetical protein
VKLARSILTEDGAVFRCTLSIATEDIADFLALLPSSGRVVDVPTQRAREAPSHAARELAPGEAPVEAPAPAAPQDPNKPPTQIVNVDGLLVGKLGTTKMSPKVAQLIHLVRDPQFQAWAIEREGKGMPADAVMFASEFVCRELGTANPMELPESEYHRIDALIASYTKPKSSPVDPPAPSG